MVLSTQPLLYSPSSRVNRRGGAGAPQENSEGSERHPAHGP
jgi:hypothetical protein